ncbi:MAG: hypothetical protein ABL977_05165 [Candidatus Eisenbacteria bacterium]
MHAGRVLLIGLLSITPFSIVLHERGDTLATVTTADGTQIEIAAGTGEYAFVSRGCNGQITGRRAAAFRDAAVRVQQPVGGGLALGVRAGIMHDDIAGGDARIPPATPLPGEIVPPRQVTDNHYVNPYFVYERPGGSVGLGYVWHERDFPTAGEFAREQPDHPLNDLSGHLRIGPERNYFEMRWMEGMPLAADGGFFTIGGGGRPNGGPTTVFVGLGAGGPYEGAGLALRVGRDVGDFNVGVRTRLGMSGGANATGVGLGIQYSPRATRRR